MKHACNVFLEEETFCNNLCLNGDGDREAMFCPVSWVYTDDCECAWNGSDRELQLGWESCGEACQEPYEKLQSWEDQFNAAGSVGFTCTFDTIKNHHRIHDLNQHQ